jgi:hypothetical protein
LFSEAPTVQVEITGEKYRIARKIDSQVAEKMFNEANVEGGRGRRV